MSAFKLPDFPSLPKQAVAPLKWIGYPIFALLCFTFALHRSLPRDRIRDQVLTATGSFLNADVKASDFDLTLLPGLRASGVTLTARPQPGAPPLLGPDGKPEKPTRVSIDDVRILFDPIAFARGFADTSFAGHLAEGAVRGKYRALATETHVELDVAGLQLKALPMLATVIGLPGVPLHGQLTLKGDLTVPEGLVAKSDGGFDLSVVGAQVGDGTAKLVVPSVPYLAAGITVPQVRLGKVEAGGTITKGKLVLRDVKAHSADIDLEVEGYIDLLDPPQMWQLHLYVKVKPSDELLKREPGIEAMVNLGGAPAKRADGYYGIAINGSTQMPNVVPAPQTPTGLKPAAPVKSAAGEAVPALPPPRPLATPPPLPPPPPVAPPPPMPTPVVAAPPPPPPAEAAVVSAPAAPPPTSAEAPPPPPTLIAPPPRLGSSAFRAASAVVAPPPPPPSDDSRE